MEDIFLSSDSPNGRLRCIIDSDTRTVWMYLHDLENKRVIADAPICSRVNPISLEEFKNTYARGDVPPFVVEYVTDRAVVSDIQNTKITIQWSSEGEAVVAFIDDEPFSMIIEGKKKGMSKAIKHVGPWGVPWDSALYEANFG